MKQNTWKNIWEEKAKKDINRFRSKISGFEDRDIDKIVPKMVDYVEKKLKLKELDSIFELGCGGCMLLKPLSEKVISLNSVGGSDISPTIVEFAKYQIPKGCFVCSHSDKLNISSNIYTKVFSNSVFQYFPNLEYAEKALKEMIRISKERILIMDIPDIEKKDKCEENRKKLGKKQTPHLYYSKSFFHNILKGYKYKIEDNKPLTSNSKYRFNIIIEKDESNE